MRTGCKRISLFYRHGSLREIRSEELFYHSKCLGVSDHLHFRVTAHQIPDHRTVIRFHVIDNQIIQFPSVEHMLQIFKKLSRHGRIDCIQKYRLLIQ